MLTVPLPDGCTVEHGDAGWRVHCEACGYDRWLAVFGPVPIKRLARWLQRMEREHVKAHREGEK